jgi:ABC-type dipeptide/oligopeptide/nickel transport system permease subunit
MINFFPWRQAFHKKTVWFSLGVMLSLIVVALLAPWISPHDPFRWEITRSRIPPMWVQDPPKPGTAEYPLGTDQFGRDILSRLIYGTRTAIFLALTAVPLAALIGTLIGLVAGYAGGRLDSLLTLFTDMIQSIPGIMFMVIIVLIFRSILSPTWFHGLITLVFGFAAVSWVSLARLIRINVQMIKSQLFMEAAISIGSSPWHIITRHILPNVMHVIMVWIINNIPAVILLEATIGYIGISVTSAVGGSEFSVISWGGLFFSGRSMLSHNPLMLIIPSLGILLISMSFILLGDFLSGISRQETE